MNISSTVSLADLLRINASLDYDKHQRHAIDGEAERDAAFAAAGYIRRVKKNLGYDLAEGFDLAALEEDEIAQANFSCTTPIAEIDLDAHKQDDRPWYWRVVADMPSEDQKVLHHPLKRPAWIDRTPPATREELVAPKSTQNVFLPPRVPLVRPARLAAYLRQQLARVVSGSEPDIVRICSAWSRGHVLARVPMRRVARWPARVQVVLDHEPAQRLFHDDLWPLIYHVQRLLGERVDVLVSDAGPNDLWRPSMGRMTRLPAATPGVLLLGAMGARSDPQRAQAWARWARIGARQCEPAMMLTTGGRLAAQRFASFGMRVAVLEDWDTWAAALRPVYAGTGVPAARHTETDQIALSGLIACLHGNPCVTPEILRALRRILRKQGYPLALHDESTLYNDVVFHRSGTNLAVRRGYQVVVGRAFSALPEKTRMAAVELQMKELLLLSPLVRAEYIERVALALSDRDPLYGVMASEKAALESLYRGMASLMSTEHPGDPVLKNELTEYLKRYGQRSPDLLATASVAMQTAWVLACRDRLKQDGFNWPDGVRYSDMAWIFGKESEAVRIVVDGNYLKIIRASGWNEFDGYLVEIHVSDDCLVVPVRDNVFGDGVKLDVFGVFELKNENFYAILTGGRVLLIESFRPPRWADSVWRVGDEWRLLSAGREIAWTPLRSGDSPIKSACWWDIRNRDLALAELANCERDSIGWWSEFRVNIRGANAVKQRMRWIPPGEFSMGSPDTELDRSANERQHQVVLTRGFWLADTACTQNLWEAVMGFNPSRFKDYLNNPVEQVSWSDVVGNFIPQLNERVPGLNFVLPSEAQWEYACRAGTTTPFWFGMQVSPNQINYDGNYPYGGAVKGQSRRETVPVKALYANDWGLYQMHGNVWEWCADEFAEYPFDDIQDPVASQSGSRRRMLRGGSCFRGAKSCRSAHRRVASRDDRQGRFGFRIARELVDPAEIALSEKNYSNNFSQVASLVDASQGRYSGSSSAATKLLKQLLGRWRKL